MAPISIDPSLSPQQLDNAIHLESPADTNDLSHGDIVESWDYTFRWDEDCMNADQLEE